MLKFVSSRDKVPQWEYQNSYNMLFLSSTKRSGSTKPNQTKPDQAKPNDPGSTHYPQLSSRFPEVNSLFRFHRIMYCLLINLWALTFLKTNVHFFLKEVMISFYFFIVQWTMFIFCCQRSVFAKWRPLILTDPILFALVSRTNQCSWIDYLKVFRIITAAREAKSCYSIL